MNIKKTFVSGISWTAGGSIFIQGINFVVGIYLARILGPDEIGLLGMVAIFIAISSIFTNAGFSEALMRQKSVNDQEYNTVFFYNILVSSTFAVILYFSGPVISAFYGEPRLTAIVHVLSVNQILGSLILVQKIKLAKDFRFKEMTIINTIGVVFSSVLGILLAISNWGIWSLIYKTLCMTLIMLLGHFYYTKWIPKLQFKVHEGRRLFNFGGKLFALGLIDTIYNNIYYVIIGKIYNPAILGQYTRAMNMQSLPIKTITSVIQQVSFPMLADIQNNKKLLIKTYKKIFGGTMLLSLFVMFLLTFISEELILILLGKQWSETGQFLKLLCFVGMFYPLDALNSNVLKIKNKPGFILKIGLLRKIVAIPVILTAMYLDIYWLIIGMITLEFISFFLISFKTEKLIGFGTMQQLKLIAPFLFSGGLVLMIELFFELNITADLLLLIFLKIMLMSLTWFIILTLTKNEIFIYSIKQIYIKLNEKK